MGWGLGRQTWCFPVKGPGCCEKVSGACPHLFVEWRLGGGVCWMLYQGWFGRFESRGSADRWCAARVAAKSRALSDQEPIHKYLNGEVCLSVCLWPQEGPKVPLCVLMV